MGRGKMNRLTDIKVSPEKYAPEIYRELPEAAKSESLMLGDINRRFISGLIRFCRPKNILEVGVAHGGGTSVILNAIRDTHDTKLVSIDRVSVIDYSDLNSKRKPQEVGYIAKELYPAAYESGKAKLFTGVDPSEVIENAGGKFDFVVLDTMHLHPIETLNFLTIYPFLTEDAIVVIDDIMLQFQIPGLCATRLLFNCITADKYILDDDDIIAQNVAAFQLNPDTPKYIDDVFRALYMNWYMYSGDVFSVRKIIEKYYSESKLKIFDLAAEYNEKSLARVNIGDPGAGYRPLFNHMYKQSQDYAFARITDKLKTALKPLGGKNLYFYCAGKCTQFTVNYLEKAGLTEFMPKAVFDRNFDNIEHISGIPVIKPDFSELTDNDLIIVALYDETEAESIVKIIKAVGFSNICTVQSLGLPINFI
jgi:predicted O-methyltransferase YrrM